MQASMWHGAGGPADHQECACRAPHLREVEGRPGCVQGASQESTCGGGETASEQSVNQEEGGFPANPPLSDLHFPWSLGRVFLSCTLALGPLLE